jgi:tetratricopeptide (TPR) repeat protein
VDTLERRFADARLSAHSVEARVQRADLLTRLFDDPPARVRVGRFEITAQLGAGGMGRVYAARDPQLHRAVAIKVLHAGAAPERLAREARAMARINHPHVVQLFDVGKTGDHELFVAMELVDGDTLGAWIGRGDPHVETLLVHAGRGLVAAHEAGVLHRDFKPANVLVTREGVAKVTDFGLASSGVDDGSTQAGTVLGTPAYMAPEQRLGKEVDERADQFAFCVTCVEALFGERPILAEGPDALARQLERLRPRGRRDARVFAALTRGLAWDPRARWPHMRELLRAMEMKRGRRPFAIAGLAIAGATLFAIPTERERAVVLGSIGAQVGASVRIGAAERLVDAGEYEPAMQTLEHAFELATAHGIDRTAADAAARLEFVAGHLVALPREGMRWSRHAEARLQGLEGAELIEARHRLNTGLLRAGQGDDRGALEYFDRALALRTDALGPDHPDVAEVWGTIGNHAYERGDYVTARAHLGRAVAIVEAAPARDEIALAMLLDDLGNADQRLGDFATAQDRYERALALRQLWRGGHPHLVTSWTNLGYLAAERGDLVGAEAYYRLRIDAAKVAFGEDDHRVGLALADLGELMIGASRLDDAHELYGRALVIAETEQGSDHGETARCHAGLGRIHLRRGDLERAEIEILRAQASWRAAYAPDHPVQERGKALLAALERAKSEL